MAENQTLKINISGETVELEKSLKNVNNALLQSKRDANSLKEELKFDGGNIETLAKRHEKLGEVLELTKAKSELLREELDKVDPQVDPKAFIKLKGQLDANERVARTFSRQLDVASATLSRLQKDGSTFKFDPGDGAVEFRNTLDGVNAALSTLGGNNLVSSFSSAATSAEGLKSRIQKIDQATDLLNRKASILKAELATTQLRGDDKGFARIQSEINKTAEEINKLNALKVSVNVDVGAVDFDASTSLNDLRGELSRVQQDMRKLGEISDIVTFDQATSTAAAAAEKVENLRRATELTAEKLQILQGQMLYIDPNVDSEGLQQLRAEIAKTEADLQTLRNAKIDIDLFSVDVDGELIQFTRTIDGIDAALSLLPNPAQLLKFDAPNASATDLKNTLTKTDTVAHLLTDRAELLHKALSTIDPKVNPKDFVRLSKDIKTTEQQARDLDALSVDVKAKLTASENPQTFGSKISRGIVSTAGKFAPNLTKTVSNGLNSVMSTAKGFTGKFGGVLAAGASASVKMFGGALSQLKGITSGGLAGVVGVVGSVGSKIGGALSSAITKPFSAIGSGLKTIVQGGLLTIGNKITTAAGGLVSGVFDSLQDAAKSSKSLSAVLSFSGVDTSKIDEVNKKISDYAKNTTYASSELNKSVSALSASGVEAGKSAELTEALGNAYALLGDGSRSIGDLGVIMSQVNSATKLTAEDFNQLRDAGLGGALRKEIENSFPDIIKQFGSFSKAMSEGAISADMVNTAISNIGNSDAAQKAAKTPKTMGEAFDTLQETIAQKFASTFEDVSAKGIDFVQGITSKIDEMDFSKLAQSFEPVYKIFDKTTKIAGSLFKNIDISKVTGSALSGIDSILDKLGGAFSPSTLGNLGARIGSVFSATFGAIGTLIESIDFQSIITSILGIFDTITYSIQSLKNSGVLSSIAESVGASISSLVWIARGVVSAIVAMFTNIDAQTSIASIFDHLKNTLALIADFAKSDVLRSLGEFLGVAIFGTLELIASWLEKIVNIAKTLFEGIDLTPFTEALGVIRETLKNMLENYFAPIQEKLDKLKNNGTLDTIWEAFGKIGNAIKELLKVFQPIFELFSKFIGKLLGEQFSRMIQLLALFAKGIGELADFLSYLFAQLSNFTGKAADWLSSIFGFEGSGVSSSASYSTVSSAVAQNSTTSTTNNTTITVNAQTNASAQEIAREVRYKFDLGIA